MTKWWLVTWTTYGSWLPGDPRGFRTWRSKEYVPPPKRYSHAEETTYEPIEYQQRHESSQQATKEAITFSSDQQRTVLDTMVADIEILEIEPAALSVDYQHVHFLARFGKLQIRPTVGRLKSFATRALNCDSNNTTRFWAKNCHMRSLEKEHAFENALRYVTKHREQGALVHVWQGLQD